MPDDVWTGGTYYGREQVKAASFNKWLVGGYVFLAGLSGGAALLSALLDLVCGAEAAPAVRRGRLLSLLAPTLGTAALITDLHTPRRFYNMLRLVKATSPMSFGSWLLVGFGGASTIIMLAELVRPGRWLRAAQVPAALAGAGLGTYTAALLSATSTPLWAAAPCATAVRFAASSIATAAAALSLGERRSRLGRDLDKVALAALALELAGTVAADETCHRTGVASALKTPSGAIQETGATVLGTLLPIGLLAASLLLERRRAPVLSGIAAAAILAGGATFRVAFLATGAESARRPEVSLRLAQPDNLSRMRGWPLQARD